MSGLPICVRPAREGDYAFIVDAWRKSFQYAPSVAGASKDHLFGELSSLINGILARGDAIARIACDVEDEDVILGFAVVLGRSLLYAYVKRDLRRHGLVPQMLDGVEVDSYVFRTFDVDKRLKPRERGWAFTPRFTL